MSVMLKNLFSSEARIILLNQFLMHPDQEFYLRQLSNRFELSPRAVSLELKNLESIELITKRISGKQHYYAANKQHPLFSDLQNIFMKTIGLKDVIRKHLVPQEKDIQFCFIYGSLAKGNATTKSDVDLMIVGKLSSRSISGSLLKAGQELDREINFSIFSLDEVENRLKKKDHFLTTLFHEPKIFVLGDSHEFKRMGKEWMAETT